MKKVVVFLIVFLILLNSVSAIRIGPAKVEGNFRPGMETEIIFNINSGLDRNLEIYVRGDLAEYVELSETKIFKQGQVIAKIKLPDEIEPPGPKKTYVGARELIDEELAAGAVGTAVSIEAVILIHVPYPGKYLETKLTGHNVNIGEPVTFNLNVISRGKEDASMKPRIQIYSEHDELLDTLFLNERVIKSQKTIELKKILETTSYSSGDYYALSKINYDVRTAESRFDFKIGDLVINIINYTRQIVIGGIKELQLEIESGWNDKIDGAYAEIVILNNSKPLIEFKTSPTDLHPWETRIIKGYFDTDNISPGVYDTNVTVIYYGRDRGKSISQIIQIEFIEEEKINYILIAFVIGVCILIMVFLIIRLKNAKKKK